MSLLLQDRLNTARLRRFVGRADERAMFESALAAPELPFHVLHVHGPGGVGKTTLLGEFGRVAERAAAPAIYVDARQIEPSPESFTFALQLAMGVEPPASPLGILASYSARQVVMIDTYERLAPLDGWLREVFLPELPENTLVVLSGREPPAAPWRVDPGWQGLVRTLPLRNLSVEESRLYLTMREVPDDQHAAILDFTQGHPLALSLVADVIAQRPGIRFQPEAAPDVIQVLLEQFVQKVPGPAHRAALEACALVRVTTEGLLSEMLLMPDAHELFDWLRGLSFVESRREGLFLHDLAREAVAADVRWRNPDWYGELHRRARTYYTNRVLNGHSQEQQRALIDLLFLHRSNPVVRPAFEWQETGAMLADAARETDHPALLQMVEQHEGEASAALAAHWLERQPRGVVVVRDAQQQPAGFLAMIALEQASDEDRAVCPAARAAWRYLKERAPLRPGETATLFRFWMAQDTYQAVSAIQTLLFVNTVRHYLTTPGLAFTFFPCADPDSWAPVFAYIDLARIPEADFEVDGRRYGVFGHDWRTVPPVTWLAMLGEREVTPALESVTLPEVPELLAILSESEFTDAVHDALRDLPRPDVLRGNLLLRSRLVTEHAGAGASPAERAAVLQSLVRDATESLQASPREAKYYRALHQTYLQPAATQEVAAELLDLPFSTYRRHLKEGIARVAASLWLCEVNCMQK